MGGKASSEAATSCNDFAGEPGLYNCSDGDDDHSGRDNRDLHGNGPYCGTTACGAARHQGLIGPEGGLFRVIRATNAYYHWPGSLRFGQTSTVATGTQPAQQCFMVVHPDSPWGVPVSQGGYADDATLKVSSGSDDPAAATASR